MQSMFCICPRKGGLVMKLVKSRQIEEVNTDKRNICNKIPLDKQAEIIYGGEVKAFLNASEAARILQVDRATIIRWIRKGVIQGARRPEQTKQWRIPFSSCEALLKQHESR